MGARIEHAPGAVEAAVLVNLSCPAIVRTRSLASMGGPGAAIVVRSIRALSNWCIAVPCAVYDSQFLHQTERLLPTYLSILVPTIANILPSFKYLSVFFLSFSYFIYYLYRLNSMSYL